MYPDFAKLISQAYGEMLALISNREKNALDRILTRIYQNGPAPEHWYKFELFSQLYRLAAEQGLKVGIERQYSKGPKRQADLVIEQNEELVAIIELKVVSNWSLKGNLKTIDSDIKKISQVVSPAKKFLLLIVQFAKPQNKKVEWMEKQIISEQTAEENEFRKKINNHIEDCSFPLKSVTQLGLLKLDNELFKLYELGGVILEI